MLRYFIFPQTVSVSSVTVWCRDSAALSSATEHTIPPEIGGKWGTKWLNPRFPLRTLLCAKNILFLFSWAREKV